jgi:hypothetical protein
VRAAALVLAALALTACESSQEENAKLAKLAKQEAQHRASAHRGLSIVQPSTEVKVLATKVISDSEGAAVVVTLRNLSDRALRHVPIEIDVKDAAGATVYTNTTPGLARTLVTIPLLAARSTSTWVNDQVQPSPTPTSVSAKVGEGEQGTRLPSGLSVTGVRLSEGQVEGSLHNHSREAQHELVLYAIARRAGAIVAAGTAVVEAAEANASEHFQAPLIGNANGAPLEVNVAGAA